MMTVREFSRTEGLSNFVYKRDGMTNWQLSPDFTQINWNGLTAFNYGSQMGGPGTGIASFLDGSSLIMPPPSMLVTYRAKPDRCPLCLPGQHLSKDVDFDLNGRLRMLSGTDKVRQLVFKAILTEIGANEILPDYGSTLSASIGQKFDTLMQMRLYSGAQQAIQFLVNEQQTQPVLPLNETILNVSNVGVVQDSVDPRVIEIAMEVQVADFTKVSINFNLVTS